MDDGQPELKGADGMCVDRVGNVYCAGPNHIWIWDSSGKLLDKIVCPERAVNWRLWRYPVALICI